MADYGAAQVVALVLMSDLVRPRVTLIATPGFGEGALAAIAANRDDLDRLNWANPSIGASPGPLQRIPVKLTHSQHVESSCGILHEKVSE